MINRRIRRICRDSEGCSRGDAEPEVEPTRQETPGREAKERQAPGRWTDISPTRQPDRGNDGPTRPAAPQRLAGAGMAAGARYATQGRGICGPHFLPAKSGEKWAWISGAFFVLGHSTADHSLKIPQTCATFAAQSARRPNLDFGRDCLVRDAVRSERCSSLFLTDFPVFG